MSWLMVYATFAVATLSVAGAWCCARTSRRDPARLVAIFAAAALWPIVVVGVAQLGLIAAYAHVIRRQASSPGARPMQSRTGSSLVGSAAA